MAHRGLVTALLATALVLAATGCSGSPSAPTSSPSSSPSSTSSPSASSPSPTAVVQPERPTKDGCHFLTYDEAIAPVVAGADVRCGQRHTAQTFKIGRLDLVSDGHLRAVDSPDVQAEVARTCTGLLGEHVGGSVEDRRLSMVQAVWFTPSVEDAAAAADWFRCDVVALASAGELLPLPPDSRGLVASSDRFAMCGTAEPGAASFERVACSVGDPAWRRDLDRGPAGVGVPHRRRRGVADGVGLSLGGTRPGRRPARLHVVGGAAHAGAVGLGSAVRHLLGARLSLAASGLSVVEVRAQRASNPRHPAGRGSALGGSGASAASLGTHAERRSGATPQDRRRTCPRCERIDCFRPLIVGGP